MNESVDRRRGEGIAPDEERMKTKQLPEMLVADILRDHAIDRTKRLQLNQLWRNRKTCSKD